MVFASLFCKVLLAVDSELIRIKYNRGKLDNEVKRRTGSYREAISLTFTECNGIL